MSICDECGLTFNTTTYQSYHKSRCLSYNYKMTFNKLIDNVNLNYVIRLYHLLDLTKIEYLEKIDNKYYECDLLSISSLLDKLKIYRATQHSQYLLYVKIYNEIVDYYILDDNALSNKSDLEDEYISYNELINIISKFLNLTTEDINNIIQLYKNN